MILQFPYLTQPVIGPVPPSLPVGTTQRWRPYIPITLRSLQTGQDRPIRRALVDTGADDTVFPLSAATGLGVSLLPNPGITSRIRWLGSPHHIQFGEVELELRDGATRCMWRAIVAFTSAHLPYPLLGQAGFLQFFNATFRGTDRVTELEPVPGFPATVT